jgi:3-hydroxybutyryl-CoA dehydrogenase
MAAATIAARITVAVAHRGGDRAIFGSGDFRRHPRSVGASNAQVLARASALAGPVPIIASTTSTILADDLASALSQPQRFLNAHWLNPAYLVPLVELSPAATTDPSVTAQP